MKYNDTSFLGALLRLVYGVLPAAVATMSESASSEPSYRTISSRFGNNTLRIKSWPADETHLCPGAAAHHAGWADIGDKNHIFFWYHEARSRPREAPLLLWLQGSPGMSSLQGMLYENGPCIANDGQKTRSNPYSWTELFNVVYLDQPAGVGFSYNDGTKTNNTSPGDADKPSHDVIQYLKIFYEAFPHLADADLHLAGESYAGHSIPALASVILDYNLFLLSNPLGSSPLKKETIPLRSLILGNPLIAPHTQLPASYDASCFEYRGLYPPRVDKENCSEALDHLEACELSLLACARNPDEPLLCAAAGRACTDRFLRPLQRADTSEYDRRRTNCPTIDDCYPDFIIPSTFLNSPDILEKLLEVSEQTGSLKIRWKAVSNTTSEQYTRLGKGLTDSSAHLARILQPGRDSIPPSAEIMLPVHVLVYAGVADPLFDPDGVFDALRSIRWVGRNPFRATPWKALPWTLSSGAAGGRLKAVPNLWLVEVEGAGHMVAHDQAESSLNMLKLWLNHLGDRATVLSMVDEKTVSLDQATFLSEDL